MLEREKLESGEETILSASVKLDNKRGSFREHVILLSTCGDKERMDLFILAGTVIRQDILPTKRIFVGAIHRQGAFKETFVINDPGNGQLKKVEIVLQEPVSWINSKFICEKVTEVNQENIKKLNVKPGDWIATLSAETTKDAAIQGFKIPIVIQTNLASPFDKMEVLLEGEVVPAISVEPAALIFSNQSQVNTKIVSVKSILSSLRIPNPVVRVEGDVPLLCDSKKNNDQEYVVKVKLNTSGSTNSSTFTGNIVLDFGDEGTINVPVIYQAAVEPAKEN